MKIIIITSPSSIVDTQGADRVEGPSIMVNDVEEEEEEPEDVLKVKI